MTERYQANIDGFDIEMETISDGFSKAIAKHEFPNTNGALLEDMGQHARVIAVRCFFLNDDYERHFDFLAALDDLEISEFVHPVYGLLKGCIEKVDVRHRDLDLHAEIDLTFVEDRIAPEAVIEPDVEGAAEEAFLDSQDEQMSGLEATIASALQGYQAASAYARDFTAQVEDLVTTFEGTLVEITQPVNTLIATINYATSLPGRLLGSIAKYMERKSLLYSSIKNAPSRFVQSFRDGTTQLLASLPASNRPAKQAAINIVRNYVQVASAAQLALDLATLYKVDEQERKGQKKMETGKAFDSSGNYLAPVPVDPIMTVQEIEKTLADVRSDIQTAIDIDRSMRSLQAMAWNLTRHANKIKLEAEKIYTVNVDGEIPLHLLCLKHGLPYNYAERILAINPQIKNPSFVSGMVSIYAS